MQDNAQDLFIRIVGVKERVSEGRPKQWELKVHWPWIPEEWRPETVWLDQAEFPEELQVGDYAVRAEPSALKRNTKNPQEPYDGSLDWMSFWRILNIHEFLGEGDNPAPIVSPARVTSKEEWEPQEKTVRVLKPLTPLPREVSIERQVALKAAVEYVINGKPVRDDDERPHEDLPTDPASVVGIANLFAAFLRNEKPDELFNGDD